MDHQVVVVKRRTYPFVARWGCICGDLLPEVPFGIPLNKAFAEHVAKKKEGSAS